MNNRGSVVLMIAMMVSALAISTYILLSSASRSSRFQNQRLVLQQVESASTSIATLLSNEQVCLNGFDGPGGENGLEFFTAGLSGSMVVAQFDSTLANSPTGQPIQLPSPYLGLSGHSKYVDGFLIPNRNLKLNKIYLSEAIVDAIDPNLYAVKVKADLQSLASSSQIELRPRDVVDLAIRVDGTGAMTGCVFKSSLTTNQTMCESMSCTYTAGTPGPGSCHCPLEPTTCPTGNYVQGVLGSTPICSSAGVSKSCASMTDYFFVAMDGLGNPICAQILRCPAGATVTGFGATTNPVECRCILAGQNWNGASCGFPYSGVCGTANGASLAAAPSTATQKCSTGASSGVSGSGPWTWACYGDYGGSNASCATGAGVAVNGGCGSSNGSTAASAPTSSLCSAGTATSVSGSGPWTWSCNGSGGGTNASCSANYSAAAVTGVCGSANGTTVSTAPTLNFCSSGIATSVSGSGPWTWSCNGSGGGANSSCLANLLIAAACGAANSSTNNTTLNSGSAGLCSGGTVAGFTQGPSNWAWNCTDGVTSTSCIATCDEQKYTLDTLWTFFGPLATSLPSAASYSVSSLYPVSGNAQISFVVGKLTGNPTLLQTFFATNYPGRYGFEFRVPVNSATTPTSYTNELWLVATIPAAGSNTPQIYDNSGQYLKSYASNSAGAYNCQGIPTN